MDPLAHVYAYTHTPMPNMGRSAPSPLSASATLDIRTAHYELIAYAITTTLGQLAGRVVSVLSCSGSERLTLREIVDTLRHSSGSNVGYRFTGNMCPGATTYNSSSNTSTNSNTCCSSGMLCEQSTASLLSSPMCTTTGTYSSTQMAYMNMTAEAHAVGSSLSRELTSSGPKSASQQMACYSPLRTDQTAEVEALGDVAVKEVMTRLLLHRIVSYDSGTSSYAVTLPSAVLLHVLWPLIAGQVRRQCGVVAECVLHVVHQLALVPLSAAVHVAAMRWAVVLEEQSRNNTSNITSDNTDDMNNNGGDRNKPVGMQDDLLNARGNAYMCSEAVHNIADNGMRGENDSNMTHEQRAHAAVQRAVERLKLEGWLECVVDTHSSPTHTAPNLAAPSPMVPSGDNISLVSSTEMRLALYRISLTTVRRRLRQAAIRQLCAERFGELYNSQEERTKESSRAITEDTCYRGTAATAKHTPNNHSCDIYEPNNADALRGMYDGGKVNRDVQHCAIVAAFVGKPSHSVRHPSYTNRGNENRVSSVHGTHSVRENGQYTCNDDDAYMTSGSTSMTVSELCDCLGLQKQQQLSSSSPTLALQMRMLYRALQNLCHVRADGVLALTLGCKRDRSGREGSPTPTLLSRVTASSQQAHSNTNSSYTFYKRTDNNNNNSTRESNDNTNNYDNEECDATFALNHAVMSQLLRREVCERVVFVRHGVLGNRLFHLLLGCRMLDDKSLAEEAVASQSRVRETLHAMHRDGLVTMQEIPKTAATLERLVKNCFFLWCCDLDSTVAPVVRVQLAKSLHNTLRVLHACEAECARMARVSGSECSGGAANVDGTTLPSSVSSPTLQCGPFLAHAAAAAAGGVTGHCNDVSRCHRDGVERAKLGDLVERTVQAERRVIGLQSCALSLMRMIAIMDFM